MFQNWRPEPHPAYLRELPRGAKEVSGKHPSTIHDGKYPREEAKIMRFGQGQGTEGQEVLLEVAGLRWHSPSFTLCTRPPMRLEASSTVTSVKPCSRSALAAARPAKPAPITTTRGCPLLRRPQLRGSSALSPLDSQLCIPSALTS